MSSNPNVNLQNDQLQTAESDDVAEVKEYAAGTKSRDAMNKF